jgi:hypothetical protein
LTREALADRLVNYADAVAAFAVVNSLAFLVALTETEVRCSLIAVHTGVLVGQTLMGLAFTFAVVALRRVELRLRTAAAPAPADIQKLLRGFFVVRIGVVWLSVALTIPLVRMALSDSTCVIPSL